MKRLAFKSIFSILIVGILAGACSPQSMTRAESFAETVFEAHLPAPLSQGETVLLEILDEITGIPLNPTRFQLESRDEMTYFIRIPLAVGSQVKYRFVKLGDQNRIEVSSNGTNIDYRVYLVKTATILRNLIAGWDETTYLEGSGEVSGYVFDQKSESPLGEVFIYLNGLRTLSTQDGFYKFENIPAGEMTLTAVHPEGKYLPFQQKAIVAENAVTPASFGMQAADFVDIKFEVKPPENTVRGAPIRILLDLYQFGNMYQELQGGGSFIPSRAPILQPQKDGTYQTTLRLPANTSLKYKYSLGDGFINAEHFSDGEFRVRTIQVPKRDGTIKDTIESWFSEEKKTLNFNISLPENTPTTDVLSFQINPFSWMEEFPFWWKSETHWVYTLYSPVEYLEGGQYRFCRNEQCGIADDAVTSGENPGGYAINFDDLDSISISYDLENWIGLDQPSYGLLQNIPASQSFLTKKGFEIDFPYDPHWNEYWENGLIEAGVSGANLIIFSPSWTFKNDGSQTIGVVPGQDPLIYDIDSFRGDVFDAGMQFGLYPRPHYEPDIIGYWSNAPQTYNWWLYWFEDYQRFLLNYANYAETYGIPYLIIAGKDVLPAIPGGNLPDGGYSNRPAEFNQKWLDLINKLRETFHGEIKFALPYGMNMDEVSPILTEVDGIHLEFSSSLTSGEAPTISSLEERMAKILDEEIYKLYALTEKPIQVAIHYSAVNGTASNCINFGDPCDQVISKRTKEITIDTSEQADVYQAILRTIVQRPWIDGFISSGFNPAVAVGDVTSSIHGKPAMDVVSFFFWN